MWRASILTIFPDVFPGPLGASLAGKAREKGIWALDSVDLRGYAPDRHRTVDDSPAGGGPGMVMKPDVIARAIDAVAVDDRPRLLMSPRGVPLTQRKVATLAEGPGVVLLCGRFEGVDERVIAGRSLEELSVGDYVLSGGEGAAMALIDDPQYTRPQGWEGQAIPEVLVSGDHAKVAAWRRAEAERLTGTRRPDLWAAHLARKPEK